MNHALIARMEFIKDNYMGYNVWAVGVTEVEVDILTGEMRTVRVDLVEDAGLSTSPLGGHWPGGGSLHHGSGSVDQ